MIALGFTLIVGVMEVINLAHGALFALGATSLYAIAVCYLLGTEWSKHGGDEPDDESN